MNRGLGEMASVWLEHLDKIKNFADFNALIYRGSKLEIEILRL